MRHRRHLRARIHRALVGVAVVSVAAAALLGRVLRLAGEGHASPWGLVVGLVGIVALTALFAMPLARWITRRLEALRATVVRWGDGDLAARASVVGNDEVAELARGFNAAAQRIEALLGAQRRLLASASHELRSPLARLRLAVELLDGERAGAEVRQGAIRDIEELDALVGDLLLASRLQGAPPAAPFATVDLGAIAAEESARVGAVAHGAATVHADAALVRRALRNLLENAVRHGGGAIETRVEGAAVHVLDRGPGVAPDEAPRIFEAFYRPAGHAEGRDGGVGLGLALVRDIARHHGGDCAYAPREGGGSVFTVRFGPSA